MQFEYRLVVKTQHGTTHRWRMRDREKAIASGQTYVDTATPYFAGSNVEVQCRELSEWHNIEDGECEEEQGQAEQK